MLFRSPRIDRVRGDEQLERHARRDEPWQRSRPRRAAPPAGLRDAEAGAVRRDAEVAHLRQQPAAGKRVAAFDHDKAQSQLISRVGARPVAADVMNFGTMFNNGNVDVVMAPPIAFKPLELHKGMGTKGAVHRFPMTILTYQMIFKRDKFPEGYGQKSREAWFSRFDSVVELIKRADATIPAKYWMDPSPEDAERYVNLMRDGRIEMAEKEIGRAHV